MKADLAQLELFRSPKRCPRFIVRLLVAANSDPPCGDFKHAFYRIKDKLLERYGYRGDVDWQEITHSCNRCDGTGTWCHWRDDLASCCWKCEGTGVYRKFWVPLQRWTINPGADSEAVFHSPGQRRDEKPEGVEIAIKGKIRHDDHKNALHAFVWLSLLFDRPTFWRFVRYRYCVGTTRFVYDKPSGILWLRWLLKKRGRKILRRQT